MNHGVVSWIEIKQTVEAFPTVFNYEIYQECSNVYSFIKIGDWKGQITELYTSY